MRSTTKNFFLYNCSINWIVAFCTTVSMTWVELLEIGSGQIGFGLTRLSHSFAGHGVRSGWPVWVGVLNCLGQVEIFWPISKTNYSVSCCSPHPCWSDSIRLPPLFDFVTLQDGLSQVLHMGWDIGSSLVLYQAKLGLTRDLSTQPQATKFFLGAICKIFMKF